MADLGKLDEHQNLTFAYPAFGNGFRKFLESTSPADMSAHEGRYV